MEHDIADQPDASHWQLLTTSKKTKGTKIMKQTFWTLMGLMLSVAAAWPAAVTVNKAGTGNYTTIQEAINSGASQITITDSETYLESLEIGDPFIGGDPVTLTSTKTGSQRPVIAPK